MVGFLLFLLLLTLTSELGLLFFLFLLFLDFLQFFLHTTIYVAVAVDLFLGRSPPLFFCDGIHDLPPPMSFAVVFYSIYSNIYLASLIPLELLSFVPQYWAEVFLFLLLWAFVTWISL